MSYIFDLHFNYILEARFIQLEARTLGNLTETVISLGLRTALVLIHFFTSFRLFASLRANKLVTLNL